MLLRIAAFGLYAYSLFGVIAGALDLNSTQHLFVLITSVLTIVQVTLQTLFISDVVCRKRSGPKQPGRQLITFLLIINLTLWIVYTFEMQKLESSPVQLRFVSFQFQLRFVSCHFVSFQCIRFHNVGAHSSHHPAFVNFLSLPCCGKCSQRCPVSANNSLAHVPVLL